MFVINTAPSAVINLYLWLHTLKNLSIMFKFLIEMYSSGFNLYRFFKLLVILELIFICIRCNMDEMDIFI